MDNLAVLSLLAFLPILAVGVLLVGLRWPAKHAMPVGFLIVVLVALFVWEMTPTAIAASTVQGLLIAATLLYIVFGALLLLETLTKSGAMATIRAGFTSISPDRRVPGRSSSAGCSAASSRARRASARPAAVVRPLLLALGFPAMAAVMVGLFIQSTPVSFGAVGTPMLVGVQNGLVRPGRRRSTRRSGRQRAGVRVGEHRAAGRPHPRDRRDAHPADLSCMLCGFFGERKRFADGPGPSGRSRCSPAFAMTIPYVAVAGILGPEFPSLLGGLLGLALVMFTSARASSCRSRPGTSPPATAGRPTGWAASRPTRTTSPSAR
jgi:lactate permease